MRLPIYQTVTRTKATHSLITRPVNTKPIQPSKKNPIQLPKHRQTQHITHTQKKKTKPFKFHHFSALKQKPNVKTANRGRIIITGADSAHVPKRDNSSPIRLYAILSPKLKASGGHGSKFANSNGGVKY